MKTLFLSSLIVLCLLIAYENRKSKRLQQKYEKDFWDREEKANHTRKKPIRDLPYIIIPFDTLPMDALPDTPENAELMRQFKALGECRILNLTGISNTDLKLTYGTANITPLSEYDENYTVLVRLLQEWADKLYLLDKIEEAEQVLNFALSTGTDVSHSYYMLAEIYEKQNQPEKVLELMEQAGKLTVPMGKVIVQRLQEGGPYTDWLDFLS